MMPAGPSWGKRATPITHDHHNSKENGVDERSVACSTQTSWNFVREKKRKESHLEFFVCPSQLLMFHVLVSFFFGGGAGSYVVIAYGPKLHKKEKKTS
jgi:hypothetical protein